MYQWNRLRQPSLALKRGPMSSRICDVAILGGGLSGGLTALAIARLRPDLSLLLVEQGDTLGGNHIWSFFGSDVGAEGRELLAPMVAGAWPEYEVRFPQYQRILKTTYYSITSEKFDSAIRAALPENAVLTGVRVLACSADAATLSDGTRICARTVIDARGIRNLGHLNGGWQKFLGQRLRLPEPHGLTRPVIMDATVDQIDGYRFVYCLPFSPKEVFVEDTYYSDSPTLDTEALSSRIATYAHRQGWQGAEVVAEETGVLPVVSGGDLDAFWRSTGGHVARAGTRAAAFHPLTSYSVPDAVLAALTLARNAGLDGLQLADFTRKNADSLWRKGSFYRMLSAMLFGAAAPIDRYKVLQRFYRLDKRLIERFYAGRSTFADKARVLMGKPPVPLFRAIGVISGLKKLQPLNFAGTRK